MQSKLKIIKREILEGKAYFWCQCECGVKKFILCRNLKYTKSCGCSKKISNGRKKTHDLSRTRFYHIWAMMNQRCKNKNHSAFHRYGGLGIKVCWKNFEQFKNDMYEDYLKHCNLFGIKNTTLDRVHNTGNYHKNNCRWATRKEQANNTKTNIKLPYQGIDYTFEEAEKKFNIKRSTLYSRYYKGWNFEEIIEGRKQKKKCHKI